MNKELYVSTTPHETKVGITEDDQLAEIYLERENEYTLAGSIYKGRVTRVLPGMQSAFVDIGLERDAFLYVSDFMDLEQTDEDLDEAIAVPANRPVMEARPRPGLEAGGAATHNEGQLAEAGGAAGEGEEPAAAASEEPGNATGASRDFRGRRRRRGRRGEIGRGAGADRGDRPEHGETRSEPRNENRSEIRTETGSEVRNEPRNEPRSEPRNDRFSRGDRPGRSGSESRSQRSAPPAARIGRDYDYGPPPGYQPMVLPGESISKYQRQVQAVAPAPVERAQEEFQTAASAAIGASFPDDEPIFAADVSEPLHEQHEHVLDAVEEEVQGPVSSAAPKTTEFRNETRFGAGDYVAPLTRSEETAHDEKGLG